MARRSGSSAFKVGECRPGAVRPVEAGASGQQDQVGALLEAQLPEDAVRGQKPDAVVSAGFFRS